MLKICAASPDDYGGACRRFPLKLNTFNRHSAGLAEITVTHIPLMGHIVRGADRMGSCSRHRWGRSRHKSLAPS
jgi:hypothetical protein